MAGEKNILDFIVIGAQKAGTTSLFHYLHQHPEVCVPARKEAPYFSHDTAVYTHGWDTYLRNLVREGYGGDPDPAHKWGTVTPHYMVGGVYEATSDAELSRDYDERTVPSRIRERLPDVRLVAVLRDPVERAVSHHGMAVRRGSEQRAFDDAVDALLRAPALESARREPKELTGYVAWGEYGRILRGYFELFPREQMLVVFTDELARSPADVLSRIHEFIGVRADFTPGNLGRRFGVGTTARGFSWASPSSWLSPSSLLSPQGVRRGLKRRPLARAAWRAVPGAAQERLAHRYKRAATRTALRHRRSAPNEVRANAGRSAHTLERLREHYAREADELVALLGASPPWLGGDDAP